MYDDYDKRAADFFARKLTPEQEFNLRFKYGYADLFPSYDIYSQEFWKNLCFKISLSEDFIREYSDYVDWESISHHQVLSENFIREFKDSVSWECISYYQVLSESFIREFKNYVSWRNITMTQNLSVNFIEEFKRFIDWDAISFNYSKIDMTNDFIRQFKDKLDWHLLSYYFDLDDEIVFEFYDRVDYRNLSKRGRKFSSELRNFLKEKGIEIQK